MHRWMDTQTPYKMNHPTTLYGYGRRFFYTPFLLPLARSLSFVRIKDNTIRSVFFTWVGSEIYMNLNFSVNTIFLGDCHSKHQILRCEFFRDFSCCVWDWRPCHKIDKCMAAPRCEQVHDVQVFDVLWSLKIWQLVLV